MKGNIVGEEVFDFVSDQIKFRQSLHGSGTDRFNNKVQRSNKVLNYLNTRNAWVKLASGISIDSEARDKLKSILISDGYVGSGTSTGEPVSIESTATGFTDADIDGFLGKNLAQNFILFNTVQSLNNDGSYKTRSGVVKGTSLYSSFNSLYGGMGFKDQGLQPIPGIIDVSVDCINRGAIKKAVVTLKAYNKFQFSIIETLYLRLGYIMMLEYGWDKYINNVDESTTPPTIDIQNTGTTLIDEVWFAEEKGKTPSEIYTLIENKRAEYQGNYDGFMGKVTNFQWKLNQDLSYDITIDLITLGSVVTSLAANPPGSVSKIGLQTVREQLFLANATFDYNLLAGGSYRKSDKIKKLIENQKKLTEDDYLNTEEAEDIKLPSLGADAISNFLAEVLTNFNELEDKGKDFVKFANFIPTVKLRKPPVDRQGNELAYSSTQWQWAYEKRIENLVEAIENINGRFFIRFGRFLKEFFLRVNKFTKDPNSSAPNPELIFEESNDIICNYETNLIPLDPTICLFVPIFTEEVFNEVYPNLKTNIFNSNTVSPDIFNDGEDDTVYDFFPTEQMEEFVNDNFAINNTSDNPFANSIVVGQLMNLYLNIDFIKNELQSNLNTDGSITIFSFLQNICNGINRAMAGVTQLEPSLKDNITVNFIEQNLPKGYNGMLEASKPKVEEKAPRLAEFELIGYNPTTGASNFVKDFNLITKITPDLQNIISIGAAASNSSTKAVSALPLNNWNRGLINRFQEEFEETTPPKLNTTEELKKREKAIRERWVKKGILHRYRRSISATFKDGPVKIVSKPVKINNYVFNNGFGKKGGFITKKLPYKYRRLKGGDEGHFLNRNTSEGTNQAVNAFLWDNSPQFKSYIIGIYDLTEAGVTEDGREFNVQAGLSASDYISYIAQCFGGTRQNVVETRVAANEFEAKHGDQKTGTQYNQEVVHISDAQWYKQNNEFIRLGKTLYKNFKEKVDKKQYQDEGVVTMTNGFIPLQFQMTVDGLAGVKIYNKLNIDQRFLPPNYPESLSFITTKVNHKITNNIWNTEYECLSIPASTKIISDEFRIFTEKRTNLGPLPEAKETFDLSTIPDNLKKVRSVRGPHSPDISTLNKFAPEGLVFFPQETNKTQIVLHHTATDNIEKGSKAEVEGIMRYWRNENSRPPNPDAGVSTHWIVDREGNGVKVFDYKYWSRNAGVGDQVAKNQISIELCSSGWLTKSSDGTYKNAYNRIIPADKVSKPYRIIPNADRANVSEVFGSLKLEEISSYRGEAYFEEYTDAQIKLLREILISVITNHYPIKVFTYTSRPCLTRVGSSSQPQPNYEWTSEMTQNLLAGKTQRFSRPNRYGVAGGFGWCNFIANDWLPKLFPKSTVNYRGDIGNGLFTHNTFSTSKSDVFPSKKLITMLLEVGCNYYDAYKPPVSSGIGF